MVYRQVTVRAALEEHLAWPDGAKPVIWSDVGAATELRVYGEATRCMRRRLGTVDGLSMLFIVRIIFVI